MPHIVHQRQCEKVNHVRWNKFKAKDGTISDQEVDIMLVELDENELNDWDNQE